MSELVKFALLRRRSGLDHGQFSDYWLRRHARVLIDAGHREYNDTYVQNHLWPLPGGTPLPFDGAAQMIQHSDAGATAGFQEDARYRERVRPDELLFMEVDHSLAVFTRQRTVMQTRPGGPHKLMAFVRGPQDGVPGSLSSSLDAAASTVLAPSGVARPVASAVHHDVVSVGQRGPMAPDAFDAIVEWRLVTYSAIPAAAVLLERMLQLAGARDGALRAVATELVVYSDVVGS